MAQCPVDHGSSQGSLLAPSSSPDSEKCPVDHKTRSSWGGFFSSPSSSSPSPPPSTANPTATLPTSRETSSIPRADGTNWVYPSEAQFFAAMARKNHDPQANDMRVIVPIHNAVNERAWGEVLKWERGRGGEGCGGVRLVSFKGRPKDRTPKAWMKTLLGYRPPFDRHDWIVDRCGTRVRYVIDFYSGKTNAAGNLAFYLDARPAVDNWEGIKMRMEGFVEKWFGPLPWLTEKKTTAT